MKLRILKTWQGNHGTIVMQAQPPFEFKEILPKKIFLNTETNQKKLGFDFSIKKPLDLKYQGNISSIIRKHMPTIWLVDILENQESGDIWGLFQFGKSEIPDWYIMLENSSPPLANFINSNKDSLFRFGKKGTFTKRQTFKGEFPNSSYISIFKDLLNKLASSIPKEVEDLIEEESDDELNSTEPTSLSQSTFQTESKKRLKRRLKTAVKSLKKQEQKVPDEKDVIDCLTKAKLLQQYSYKIKPNTLFTELLPEETGFDKKLIIDINPEFSPGKNVDEYFVQYKKLTRAKTLGKVQLEKDQKYVYSLQNDINKIEENDLDDELIISILKKYNLSSEKQTINTGHNKKVSLPYYIFQDQNKVQYWVGKSSHDNDILTKNAKSNDFWFHVAGLTGSHIIVPNKSLQSRELTSNVIKTASILAIHFSKIRSDHAGDVYYTKKQNLKKKKGMAPGLWNVDKSETNYIKYDEAELKNVLNGATN